MFFQGNRRLLFLILGATILLAAVFLIVKFRAAPSSISDETQRSIEQEIKFGAINGAPVNESLAQSRPLAVMIENHPDARPQSGLSKADVVYEALAEGGITRFLAIFQSREADQIGSVRSAREYFAQIADEWGALYAHVGGSNEAIAQIKKGLYKNLDDANEYYNGDFFPRRKDRSEPHHIFTSTEKLQELIAFHKYSNVANFQPWEFKDDSPIATSTVSKISIDFSRPGYEAGWEYDPLSNSYKRLQYFEPHIDEASKQQITAKTVIIQIVEVTPVPKDPLLQINIDLISGGRAIIFQDGIYFDGKWRKESGRTRFYDLLGQEIKFNRGPIWVELLPEDKVVTLKLR